MKTKNNYGTFGVQSQFKNYEFLTALKEKNIKYVRVSDQNYPDQLTFVEDKPQVLFYKGKLPDPKLPSVAIIGSRSCSNYGRVIAEKTGEQLSQSGVQVISGMARGIDTYGLIGALRGKTPVFAILGSGVDICYPIENLDLYHKIIESGGGVISEYFPGEKPLAWHFPKRNRIISALSDTILVVEARNYRSGSLITVEWALEQGKDVWAVPGRIGDILSEGCNRLIKTGAGIFTHTQDILNEWGILFRETDKTTINNLPDFLQNVYGCLGLEPKSLNEIIVQIQSDYGQVIHALLQLQQMGLVNKLTGNYYAKSNL